MLTLPDLSGDVLLLPKPSCLSSFCEGMRAPKNAPELWFGKKNRTFFAIQPSVLFMVSLKYIYIFSASYANEQNSMHMRCTCIIPSMLHMYHQAAQPGRCHPQGNPEALSCKAAMHLILAFQMFIRCPAWQHLGSCASKLKLQQLCLSSSHSPESRKFWRRLNNACRLNNAKRKEMLKPDPNKNPSWHTLLDVCYYALKIRKAWICHGPLLFDADTSVKSNPWSIVSGWYINRTYSKILYTFRILANQEPTKSTHCQGSKSQRPPKKVVHNSRAINRSVYSSSWSHDLQTISPIHVTSSSSSSSFFASWPGCIDVVPHRITMSGLIGEKHGRCLVAATGSGSTKDINYRCKISASIALHKYHIMVNINNPNNLICNTYTIYVCIYVYDTY